MTEHYQDLTISYFKHELYSPENKVSSGILRVTSKQIVLVATLKGAPGKLLARHPFGLFIYECINYFTLIWDG